jgi:hypothetical protein
MDVILTVALVTVLPLIVSLFFFQVGSIVTTTTKEQDEWVMRRDENHCCFIHPMKDLDVFLCPGEGKYVYRLHPSSILTRIVVSNVILPEHLITLCEFHYTLMLKYYDKKYERDLEIVATAHTREYEDKCPKDFFPL